MFHWVTFIFFTTNLYEGNEWKIIPKNKNQIMLYQWQKKIMKSLHEQSFNASSSNICDGFRINLSKKKTSNKLCFMKPFLKLTSCKRVTYMLLKFKIILGFPGQKLHSDLGFNDVIVREPPLSSTRWDTGIPQTEHKNIFRLKKKLKKKPTNKKITIKFMQNVVLKKLDLSHEKLLMPSHLVKTLLLNKSEAFISMWKRKEYFQYRRW